MFPRVAAWARAVRRDTLVVYLAGRDPRTPLSVKILALAVALYALSPIDLIPDFIPVLGHLDDLIILPVGIMLVMRLMPADLRDELRHTATHGDRPARSWVGAGFVVGLWLVVAITLGIWAYRRMS